LAKKTAIKFLDGYTKYKDGYTEHPLAHHYLSTDTQKESEYFMQWVRPYKLNRVALRTPSGYTVTHKLAKDTWNNRLGIRIPDKEEKSEQINHSLVPYLQSRRWFKEAEKLSGFKNEQGEAIFLLYFGDEGTISKYELAVPPDAEILKVEAFSPLDYHIPEFDKHGDPKLYRILVKSPDDYQSLMTVDVHPSRVIRFSNDNLEVRFQGHSKLSVVYDAIVILSTILKSAGEAAWRWATGHPAIFTKDLMNETDLTKMKDSIGDFTRRSWHLFPSEYIDRIDLLGQAGSMLNLKSLADIAIDQIIIGTGIPRPILLGEVAGVVSGSEVNERTYFSILDREHTELESFVRTYFERDINVRKLLRGVEYYEIDWGIREVLNKMDEADYQMKVTSKVLALTQICTIDECRKMLGMKPIGDDAYGDVVLGLEPFYMAELQMAQMQMMEEQQAKEPQTVTNANQAATSAKKQTASIGKDLEKNKRLTPKTDSVEDLKSQLEDTFAKLLRKESINSLSDSLEIYPKTLNKIIKNLKRSE
jgi:hypothetical protein